MSHDEETAEYSIGQKFGSTEFHLRHCRGRKRLGCRAKSFLRFLLVFLAGSLLIQVSPLPAAAQEQKSEFDRQFEDVFAQLRTKPDDPQLQKRALVLIEAELRARPDNLPVIDMRCALYAVWQPGQAVPACSEAVSAKRDPNADFGGTPGLALQYRGFAHLCLGEDMKALQDFDAWSEQPLPQWAFIGSNKLPLFFQGVANRRLGNERQAKLDFETARMRNGGEPVQIENVRNPELGTPFYPQCIVDLLQEMRLMSLAGTAIGRPDAVAAYERGDYVEAAKWFQLAAEQSDAVAQYNLGVMYAAGQGVPQDYAEAAKWFQLAAEQSDARAQYNLGAMYINGYGVPRDHALAMKWYRMAAGQGHASAQYDLGYMYDSGQGVPHDHALAMKWYRMAAEQDHAGAQYDLGHTYAKGEGVPQDYIQAHMWFNLARVQGHANAAENRDIVAKLMTPAQIAEAEKLAREWIPK